jgi:hypothetical protein
VAVRSEISNLRSQMRYSAGSQISNAVLRQTPPAVAYSLAQPSNTHPAQSAGRGSAAVRGMGILPMRRPPRRVPFTAATASYAPGAEAARHGGAQSEAGPSILPPMRHVCARSVFAKNDPKTANPCPAVRRKSAENPFCVFGCDPFARAVCSPKLLGVQVLARRARFCTRNHAIAASR